MQKSSTGQRKGFMMLFILGLGTLIAVLMGRKTEAGPRSQVGPQALTDPMKRILKNYENWLAVSKMETAAWTSGPFLNANNPWGMQVAYIRDNEQNGAYRASSGGKLANYDSLDDAVQDLQDWVISTKFPEYSMSLPQHIAAMKAEGYFTESTADYLALVMAWQKR